MLWRLLRNTYDMRDRGVLIQSMLNEIKESETGL